MSNPIYARVRGYTGNRRISGFQIQTRRFTLCVMVSLGFRFPFIDYGFSSRNGA